MFVIMILINEMQGWKHLNSLFPKSICNLMSYNVLELSDVSSLTIGNILDFVVDFFFIFNTKNNSKRHPDIEIEKLR